MAEAHRGGRLDRRHRADRRLRRGRQERRRRRATRRPTTCTARFDESRRDQGRPLRLSRPTRATASSTRTSSSTGSRRPSPTRAATRPRTIFYSLDNEPDLWARHAPADPPDRQRHLRRAASSGRSPTPRPSSAWPRGARLRPRELRLARLRQPAERPRRRRARLPRLLPRVDARRREPRPARLVDVLDLHWYPEAQRRRRAHHARPSGAPDVAAARVQAPRSLWDPTYIETSWITQDAGVGAIRLLPRLHEKIAAHYPGTQLAITEYNYGGGDHISGAIAAGRRARHLRPRGRLRGDALGPGRRPAASSTPLSTYRNYDGARSALRRHSIAAATSERRPTPSTPASTRDATTAWSSSRSTSRPGPTSPPTSWSRTRSSSTHGQSLPDHRRGAPRS